MDPAETETLSRLAGVLALRLSPILDGSAEPTSGPDLAGLLDVLELFVPEVLRQEHQEWEVESLDGFLVADASRISESLMSLSGLAILISDQTVTPFGLELRLADDGSLERAEIRLGERGEGSLGISGPICTARSTAPLLNDLLVRLSQVDWVYRATYSRPNAT